MTTIELRRLVASQAEALRARLNKPDIDPVGAAHDARQLFAEVGDDAHVRWLNLEIAGYRDLVAVQPLHMVLQVPQSDRLAVHVAAYRTQAGIVTSKGVPNAFRHFFVESLTDLVATRDRVRQSTGASDLELQFGPHVVVVDYPSSGTFPRDVFERIVSGFVAALFLQLGGIAR